MKQTIKNYVDEWIGAYKADCESYKKLSRKERIFWALFLGAIIGGIITHIFIMWLIYG